MNPRLIHGRFSISLIPEKLYCFFFGNRSERTEGNWYYRKSPGEREERRLLEMLVPSLLFLLGLGLLIKAETGSWTGLPILRTGFMCRS